MSTYIGIDPGVNGGIAVIDEGEASLFYATAKGNDLDLWTFLAGPLNYDEAKVFAVIEQQVARPTQYYNRERGRWESSILKSTCTLYGHYQFLRGLLTAANVSYEEVLPQKWQKVLGVPPREKGMNDSAWKNVLKAKAQKLYPDAPVTLATADALLLAEYGRRVRAETPSSQGEDGA